MPTTFRRLLSAAALAALAAAAARADDALVIARAEFGPAVASWKAFRERQGTHVDVREPGADVGAVVRAARAADPKLRFVLLLGDVDRVPCAYVPVAATAKWESDTRIATDAPYADTDGDGVPDLAIGRLPARSADEARALLARSIEYETASDGSDWRRRVNVLAGSGGFGPLQDAALEQMTKQFLTRDIPPSMVVTGTYGNPLSAWCPPPREMSDTAVERMNEGELVFAYIGHGSPRELDRLKVGREKFPIFAASDPQRVEVRRGAPIAVFIACSTGKFDGAEDCLAEALVRRPKGPVAVIASSRVSTPYSNGILSKEMLAALFADRVPTVGEMLLAMKRRLVAAPAGDEERAQIEKLAAAFFDPDPARRDADRREHLALYNLLGDPCARIAYAAEMPISAPAAARAGAEIEVTGTVAEAGWLHVEVVRRRDTYVPIGARKSDEDWRTTYRAANSLLVAESKVSVRAGEFRVKVAVPADARPGPGYVRAWFQGEASGAAAGRMIDISAPEAPPAPGGR